MFEIPKTVRITKEWILQHISEESIFSYYYGEAIQPRKLYKSKLRLDKKPTCSFYKNKNKTVVYHDFATGAHYNCFQYVMEMYSIDFHTALETIAYDFGLVKSEQKTEKPKKIKSEYLSVQIEEKAETLIQIEMQPFQDYELRWWESFGVHLSTLKKFKVFSCKSVFLNGNYYKSSTAKSNIFGYYGGKKDGIQLWRIYFPQMKSFRFLSNWSKNMIQGSKVLPLTGDYVVITKSLKDSMCLYEQGIPACAPCSENTTISNDQIRKLQERFQKVFIFFDNDEPGRRSAQKYKQLNDKLILIELKPEVSKDISDCCKYNNKCFNKVIQELKSILTTEIKVSEYFNYL